MIYKYIIVESGAILFNEHTVHAIVGRGFQQLNIKIYSAGFCRIDFAAYKSKYGVQIKCYGESESLKIPSIPEKDERIIADLFSLLPTIKYINPLLVKELYETIQSVNKGKAF